MNSCNLESLNIHSSVRVIEDYVERFDIWCLTQKDLNNELKSAYFLSVIGPDAYALLKNLSFPELPIKVGYDKLKDILLQHFQPVNFEATERAKFNCLIRGNDQDIREFILQLQTQAAKCNFGDQLTTNLRDRLIAGINSPDLQKKLLLMNDPTFQSVRSVCEQFQDVSLAVTVENPVLFNSNKLHSVPKAERRKIKPSINSRNIHGKSHTSVKPNALGKCDSCGGNHARQTCKFRQAKCHSCGKLGHIQSVCRNHQSNCKYASNSTEPLSESLSNLSLSVNPSLNHIRHTLTTPSGTTHDFIIDTGSIDSIISKSNLAKFYPSFQLIDTSLTIRGITGHSLPLLGTCCIPILNDKRQTISSRFLVASTGPSILGLRELKKLNVHFSFLNTDSVSTIRSLLSQCSKTTGGMRIPPIHLEICGDPVFMKRRILPYGLRESTKKVIDTLCERGILQPVESSLWATPIVTPMKSDGKTPRICGDYRLTLNPRLQQQSCTTMEPEDLLNKLVGSVCFSKIDLQDAYLQIPLDEQSSNLTTINTPFGLYRYKFLPFGLSVSPAIFQNVMDTLTENLSGVLVYQDDIIVHGSDKAAHDNNLKALLSRLVDANVSVNNKKCTFGQESIKCLGYLVSADGYKPDPTRLKPLTEFSTPTNISEVRSLLGALQYYSRFLPRFTDRAKCLFDIISLNKFEWSSEHQSCVESLLSELTSSTLQPFSPQLKTVLITDASPYGIAAIIEQNEKPVICISRKLNAAERGYSQTQREALAVFWAVKRLHKFLFGIKFAIITDHEALKFIYHPTKPLNRSSSAMVHRWSILLSAYNYTIEHRSAKHIQHVDYLSRHPTESSIQTDDCLFTHPLPIDRNSLILDTKRYFGPVLCSMKRGWTHTSKRKYREFFIRRDDLSSTPDNLLCYHDRIVIPPTLRQAVLDDIHSGHLGVEKMKSLARMTCWWPGIDNDIQRRAKSCKDCYHKSEHRPSQWNPWPLAHEAWERLHIDYCGPFLGKYYALVVIDSYSKWPEVFFTTSASSTFTIQALRKLFSREGVPIVLVSDNGSHFTADEFNAWLKSIGCKHLFTAPRHPCSNGQAENFVKTLKNAVYSLKPNSYTELERGVDTFLLQYRNATHSSTKETPARLLKGRSLRSNLHMLRTSDVTFYKGNDYRPSTGVVLKNLGERMLKILDIDDLSIHRRHVDQIHYEDSGGSDSVSRVSRDNNEFSDNLNEGVRRSERLQMKPKVDYKNPKPNSSCGGCSDCNIEHDQP